MPALVLVGLCLSFAGAGWMPVSIRRNEPRVGFLDKLALACVGLSALLLVAIFIRDLATSQP